MRCVHRSKPTNIAILGVFWMIVSDRGVTSTSTFYKIFNKKGIISPAIYYHSFRNERPAENDKSYNALFYLRKLFYQEHARLEYHRFAKEFSHYLTYFEGNGAFLFNIDFFSIQNSTNFVVDYYILYH